jgi:hypothetical protein
MATLHFICGKAASGKARKLAACHGAALFCEDEWLVLLQAQIASLADYVEHTRRLRAALAPLAAQLLRIDTSIVFDFAGNMPSDRAWVRSIFESAGTGHRLDVIPDIFIEGSIGAGPWVNRGDAAMPRHVRSAGRCGSVDSPVDGIVSTAGRQPGSNRRGARPPLMSIASGSRIFEDSAERSSSVTSRPPELDIASLLGASQDRLPARHEWPACRKPDLRD